jgi:hypothetical protein
VLLDATLGLPSVVADATSFQHIAPHYKVRTLQELGRVLTIALDTSTHKFAPKHDVALWKSVRKSLPQEAPRAENMPNRILLSRADHLELAQVDDADDTDDADVDAFALDDQVPGDDRRFRRSRHVLQELQRWVRGG